MAKKIYVLCLAAAVVVLVMMLVVSYALSTPSKIMLDQYSLTQDVNPILLQMISSSGEDVLGDGDFKYVRSFEAFASYIRKHRPDVVVNPNAENPFPGLLPGVKYFVLKGDATDEGDFLIRTDAYRTRHGDRVLFLTCGGRFGSISSDKLLAKSREVSGNIGVDFPTNGGR